MQALQHRFAIGSGSVSGSKGERAFTFTVWRIERQVQISAALDRLASEPRSHVMTQLESYWLSAALSNCMSTP